MIVKFLTRRKVRPTTRYANIGPNFVNAAAERGAENLALDLDSPSHVSGVNGLVPSDPRRTSGAFVPTE